MLTSFIDEPWIPYNVRSTQFDNQPPYVHNNVTHFNEFASYTCILFNQLVYRSKPFRDWKPHRRIKGLA